MALKLIEPSPCRKRHEREPQGRRGGGGGGDHIVNKQWEVITALEQLTSRIEQARNNTDPTRLR